jgi:hypothetical protein
LLFVVAGCLVISAGVLLPALEGLRAAERERDVARAVEAWQAERLERYAGVIDDLREPGETALRGLAAEQLNLMPAGSEALVAGAWGGRERSGVGEVGVFERVEPSFRMPAVRSAPDTVLARVAGGRRSRLLMIGGGAVLVLFGLVGVEPRRSG